MNQNSRPVCQQSFIKKTPCEMFTQISKFPGPDITMLILSAIYAKIQRLEMYVGP